MRKPSANREFPPPLELECLKALWSLGEGNVKAVQEYLAPERPLAYTTIMTLLERLVKRSAVTRVKRGRTFVYTAAVNRGEIRRQAVEQLVKQHFDGSQEELIRYLSNGMAHESAPFLVKEKPEEVVGAAPTPAAEEGRGEEEAAMDTTLL